MTSVPVFFPYLGSKRVLLQDQAQPKALIKYSDYIVQKPRLSAPRSISPQVPLGLVISHLRIPKPPSQNGTILNNNSNVLRASSTDLSKIEERKPMLPILYKSPVSKRENTPESSSLDMPQFKLNPVSQSSRRYTSSLEGRRHRSFRVREVTPVNRSLPGIKEMLRAPRSEHPSINPEENETTIGKPNSKGEEVRVVHKKSCDLTRMYFNQATQPRASLPILIIHFEGVIGTCLLQVRAKNLKKGQIKHIDSYRNVNSEHFFIKKDAKSQLKQLAKLYLIVIVFPSASERYKYAMKYLLHNKFFY